MSRLTTGTNRNSTGRIRQKLANRNVQQLTSSSSVEDELWILLEYQSEVESVGVNFIIQNGVSRKNAKKVFKHFQSYIRQAKNYYYSAKALHPRSAGLLYYYSFLNLAKAALVLKEPAIAGCKIGHGVSCMPRDFSKLKKQTVKILNGGGVFPKFYEWYFGMPTRKDHSLNIQKLLNYCTDISYQNIMAGFGNSKALPGLYVVQVDANNNTGWPLIGIASFDQCRPFKKSFQSFYQNFEQITLSQMIGREYFEVDTATLSAFTFFQTKHAISWPAAGIIPTLESKTLALSSLENLLSTNYFGSNFDFYISLPYSLHDQIPMDETISIYLIMFYISNLVRYNPTYLEELLSKKEAWIIDSFIRTCPPTFLRSMVSRIANTDYVISPR